MTRAERLANERLTEQEERLANDLFLELGDAFSTALWQVIENADTLDASFRRALLAALNSLGVLDTCGLDTEAVDEAIEGVMKDRADKEVQALAAEAARNNWWPERDE